MFKVRSNHSVDESSVCSNKIPFTTKKMNLKFLFLIFLLIPHGQSVEIQVISKLINDLIENERFPTILSVISCWKQMENFHFFTSSKVRISLISQLEIAPIRKDDNSNKMCYFIDMRCNGSHEFLNRVEAAYFGHPYRWILFEPNENRLLNLTFLTDSNILLINFNETLSRYDLKQGEYFILEKLKNSN